jgi:hypothetical protein
MGTTAELLLLTMLLLLDKGDMSIECGVGAEGRSYITGDAGGAVLVKNRIGDEIDVG